MNTKKRYVIGFWIAAALVIALAVALVAVLAAFTATANSSFSVSYSASNVNATINAGRYNGESDATTSAKYIEDVVAVDETSVTYTQFGTKTFNDTTVENEEGAFENQEISFDSKGDYTFIKLEIKNNKGDDTNAGGPIDCTITYNNEKCENIVIEYKTSDASDWVTLSDGTIIEKEALASEDSFVCYVRIRLDNRNQNASIEGGNFEINLSVA